MAGRPSPSSLLGEGFLLFDGNGLLDAAIDGVIFLFSSKKVCRWASSYFYR